MLLNVLIRRPDYVYRVDCQNQSEWDTDAIKVALAQGEDGRIHGKSLHHGPFVAVTSIPYKLLGVESHQKLAGPDLNRCGGDVLLSFEHRK